MAEGRYNDGTRETAKALADWVGGLVHGRVFALPRMNTDEYTVVLETLDGVMVADPGATIHRDDNDTITVTGGTING